MSCLASIRRHGGALLVLSLLSAFVLGNAAWVRRTKSITFDETYYLNCGLQTVHDGRLDPRIAAEGVAPLPVVLTYVPPLLFQPRETRSEPWFGQPNDPGLIGGPRLWNTALIALPLVLLVFSWVYRAQGLGAATLAASLMAFSPTFLAHASIATMDISIALFSTLALAATGWYFCGPSRARFVLWGISIAFAMSAKYSGVFLLPMSGLLLFLHEPGPLFSWPSFRKKLSRSIWSYLKLMAIILPVWWGLHGFGFTGPLKNVPLAETPDFSPWVKILGRGPWATWFMDLAHEKLKRPAPIAGVVFQYLHNQGGHPAYLLGDVSHAGRWDYFPIAFFCKSTPVEIGLAAMLLLLLIAACRSPATLWSRMSPFHQAMAMGAFCFISLIVTANINIGHRYLILLYPLLLIGTCEQIARKLKASPRMFAVLGGVLIAIQATSAVRTAPDHLSYFNAFVGGSENAWRLLSDSNLDWGQDLPALSALLAKEGHPRTALSYFGTALPAAYGIAADRFDRAEADGTYDWLAVSVTHLQGLYLRADDPLRKWRAIPADAHAGYSIRLYRLNTPDRQQLFEESREQMTAGYHRWQAAEK